MVMLEIINIIGMSAYTLLAVFFLWVAKIPDSNNRAYFWLIAVLLMLAGRLNLYFLPALLSQTQVQMNYALILSFEKLFLLLGLLTFTQYKHSVLNTKNIIIASLITIIGLALLYWQNKASTLFLSFFSTTQAGSLIIVAILLNQFKPSWFQASKTIFIALTIIYAGHWLTFPIAIHYPTWLSFGYLFGNILNLSIYLFFAYMTIYRFQYRMTTAEKSALKLAHQAQQASIAKSEFLANMSHEIRTPMNGILSMLVLLKQDDLTKEQQERVTIAFNSGKTLLAVINDILDFSKIEAGKLSLDKIEFSLQNLLEELVSIVKTSAENKQLTLLLDSANITEDSIYADPNRIKQILLNLVSNAIKFTPKGKIIIRAATQQIDQQLFFHCEVIDTGIGINEHKLDKIFSSFLQEDTSTTREYGGTGLGLTICQQLCHLMEGYISVKSEKNKGSTFSIKIPISAAKSNKKAEMAIYDSLNILIVDNCYTSLDIIERILMSWQIPVTCACSYSQAMHIGEHSKPFDLILIDHNIIECEQEQAIAQLQQQLAFQTSELILLANKNELSNLQPEVAAAFTQTLTKPVISSMLFDLLQNFRVKKEQTSNIKNIIPQNHDIPSWPEGTNLLLVEDNRINQIVATQLLAKFNLTCDIANNGQEAIKLLQETKSTRYNAILMDCQMPIMDGYSTTNNIRAGKAGEAYKNIAILAMTANAMAGDKEKCLAAGMNDYISKPLDSEDLLTMLKQWLT